MHFLQPNCSHVNCFFFVNVHQALTNIIGCSVIRMDEFKDTLICIFIGHHPAKLLYVGKKVIDKKFEHLRTYHTNIPLTSSASNIKQGILLSEQISNNLYGNNRSTKKCYSLTFERFPSILFSSSFGNVHCYFVDVCLLYLPGLVVTVYSKIPWAVAHQLYIVVCKNCQIIMTMKMSKKWLLLFFPSSQVILIKHMV